MADSQLALFPELAPWSVERSYLSHGHLKHTFESDMSTMTEIGSFPLIVQEQMVLDDLLSCFTGISGKYVRMECVDGRVRFDVDRTLDYSLSDLTSRITPMADHYIQICDFVEEHSRPAYGLVNHALTAAIRLLLREYLIRIAQLEHHFLIGELSLQKLWFFVQPHMRTLQLLRTMVETIQAADNPRGGALLNVLHRLAYSVGGDEKVRKLFLFLIEKSSAPFLGMIGEWVYRGTLDDVYLEFLVESRESSVWHNDTYWEKRYVLREACIPDFLSSHVAKQILVTGKYLNVFRECGLEVVCPEAEPITFVENDRINAKKIEVAYEFASTRLLDMLIHENNVMAHLKTLKRYFFLEQGDWLVHFVDSASSHLSMPVSEIQLSEIQSLLEHAIRSASTSSELQEHVGCEFRSDTCLEEVLHVISIDGLLDPAKHKPDIPASSASSRPKHKLSAMETFTLVYNVKWWSSLPFPVYRSVHPIHPLRPLSLVLSAKTLTKYRWMFRQIWTYKHVEHVLNLAFLKHQGTKGINVQSAFMASYGLRRRMLHFLKSLQHYLVFDVIEKNWSVFEAKFKTVRTIDGLLSEHDHFLDKCIQQFLLHDVDLVRSLARLMSCCLRFSDYVENIARSFDVKADDVISSSKELSAKERRRKQQARARVIAENARMSASDEHYRQTVKKKEKEFDDELRSLLVTLSNYVHTKSAIDLHLECLVNQLDFNGFYLGGPK